MSAHKAHKLRVSKKVFETEDSASFYFDLDREKANIWSYKPGQYITLKIQQEEIKVPLRRAYSLCTSPLSSEFGICVKRVEGGVVSNYLIDKVKVGDEIEVIPPMGNFTVSDNFTQEKDLVFIAAGSGITPVFSMIEYVIGSSRKGDSYSRLHLLYVNRTEKDIIFKTRLDNDLSYSLKVEYYLTRQAESSVNYRLGRIDRTALETYFSENDVNCAEAQVYVCGPEGLLQTVQDYFKEKNFPSERLHYELFSSDPDSKKEEGSEGSQLSYEVKVLLDGEEFNLSVGSEENIIQKMIDADIDAPYTCLNGTCSSCMAMKNSGVLKVRKTNGLSAKEIDEGFVLACQCAPLSENVIIDFDY